MPDKQTTKKSFGGEAKSDWQDLWSASQTKKIYIRDKNRKNEITHRIEYLVEVIIVGIADVSADNFIASLALETVLNVVGTEAPNRFARNDAKQDVIVTAHVGRARPATAKVSPAECRARATASSAAGATAAGATASSTAAGSRLEAGVR